MRKHNDAADISGRLHFDVTLKKILAIFFANTLIALFIVGVQPGASFKVSLIISQCIGISIATCVIAAVNFLKTSNLYLQIIVVTVAMAVGAMVGLFAGQSAVALIAQGGMPMPLPEQQPKSYTSGLLYAVLFGSIVSYVFLSLQKISDERIKRLEIQKNAVVTEIKLLQSQMEPHFLFNTLSNVIGLIDQDPQKAKRMLEAFTLFLRATLVTTRSKLIPLSKEIEVVKNYLAVFAVRMGDRLHYTIDIPDSLLDFQVPPMLLQPLVENAIKHGLEPSAQGGELRIQAIRNGDYVSLLVADSGVGVKELSPGIGIGLENIKKRLDLLYQGQSRLLFEENKPSGVKVIIELPYETRAGNHSR